MNYFDRYLSKVAIDKNKVELLSWCCVYLSSVVIDTRVSFLSVVGISAGVVTNRGRSLK